MYHVDGVVAVARFGQTVAVEYHEVIVLVLGQLSQPAVGLALVVQVVEDEAAEVAVIARSAERVEPRAQRVAAEVVGIGALVQDFLPGCRWSSFMLSSMS